YPRAEARYLSENQISDVPAITAALTGLRGFAHLDLSKPVIRKGKSGHFCDSALKGVSHHAVVPNVNVLDDDLEKRLARLSDDEKRLFAIICRSYLAAVMPDYEYRQTAVTLCVPAPPGDAEFRAVGRIPLVQGWKAVYSANEPDAAADETEQTLPPLTDGEMARLTEPRVDAKRTQAPPRYNEGTLIDAMQNAWRFVENRAVRERLKEAKGIGTPATRAEIIKGLKKQNLLAADGKWVVPTSAGLQLFEVLRGAAPALVDPATTAEWEMQLDAVVTGKADHRRVIDAIAGEAEKLIGVLLQRDRGTVNISAAPAKRELQRRRSRRGPAAKDETADAKPSRRKAASAKLKRPRTGKAGQARNDPETSAAVRAAPTARMVAYAEKLAKTKKLPLPPGYAQDFQACRRFLDQYG
ncbi:MAG: DNA topoisomerase, partial [Rhodomicrobium sp.]